MDYREQIEGEMRILVFVARPECQCTCSREGTPEQSGDKPFTWLGAPPDARSWSRSHGSIWGVRRRPSPSPHISPLHPATCGLLVFSSLWAFEKEKENFWFNWEPPINLVKEFNLSVQLHVGLVTLPFGKYLKKRGRVLTSPPLSNVLARP